MLALLDALQVPHLCAVVLLAGVCGTFDAVASEALPPSLVPRSALLATDGLRALSSSTVVTSGAATAGVVVQRGLRSGEEGPF